MEYITVYSTRDKGEVTVLKSHFEARKLDFKIIEEEGIESSVKPSRHFQVAEKNRAQAQDILHETGYLKIHSPHEERPASGNGTKWMFIFLAALVLIIVALVITWLMNAP